MPAAVARDAVLEALASGRTRTQVAADMGLSYWQVTRMAQGGGLGRPTPPADLAERWEPLCMDPDEWEAWQGTNRRLTYQGDQAPRPCADCLLGYAAEMRAEGRCNGEPAGDHHEEEGDMPATEKQRAAWEAYHREGGQSAAGRALGIDQGAVRNALIGYMRAEGIEGYIPAPDPSRIGTDATQVLPAANVAPEPSMPDEANDVAGVENPFDASASGVTSDPAECKETPGSVAYVELPSAQLDSVHASELVNLRSSEHAPAPDTVPIADPLSLIDRELARLAEEDAALVEQAQAIIRARTDVAARIERVRTAADVIRELAERAA